MSETKTRILLVIAHLVQSGSERFAYEICKAIDRTRFDVEVLTKRRIRKSDYYYEKLRDLRVPVHRKLPILLNQLQRHARPLYLATRPLLELLHKRYSRFVLGGLLEDFDIILALQIDNYYLLQPLLPDNERIVTVLLSNAFQYPFDPYADCRGGRKYRFVITDPTQVADYAGSHCAGAETHFVPPTMSLHKTTDLAEVSRDGQPFHIGVFIRLGADRPISGLFQALAHLVEKRDARMSIYGRGDPSPFERQLEEFGIRDRVDFRGHAPSIEDALRNDNLSVAWMTCNGTTVGYASVEIASFAFPMLFWNLAGISDATLGTDTGAAIQSFQNPLDLSRATIDLLENRDAQLNNGRRMRDYVLREYDIHSHIRGLESFLLHAASAHREG